MSETQQIPHYFYSPYAKYSMDVIHPKTGKKGRAKFVEGRLVVFDPDTVEALRRNPRFGRDFHETVTSVPRVGLDHVVSTQSASPIAAQSQDLINENARRSAKLAGMGAGESEIGAMDADLSKAHENRVARALTVPGDPVPANENTPGMGFAPSTGGVTWKG